MLLRSILFGIVITMSYAGLTQASDFFKSDIVTIDIVFQETGWQDTLIARKQRDDKNPLKGIVEVNGEPYESVEIRYKGNSSFHGALKQGWQKLPLRIKTSSDNLFAGRYEKLRLANNYRDPSAIRELLAYRIAGTYIPVPEVVPAVVTINGDYQGLYTLTEGMGSAMLEDYFCDGSGVLIQCEPNFRAKPIAGCPKGNYANLEYLGEETSCYERLYEFEGKKDKKALIELTRRLEKDKRLDTVIDIHQTLWMHAINNVLVNLDSYLGLFCHNYFVYRDQHGIYHPLIWDLNLAFGGFSSIAYGESPEPIRLSPIAHDRFNLGNRPLIQKLTEDKINVRLYFWMMRTIVTDWISSGKYLEFADELQGKILPYVEREKKALYSVTDFEQSMSETIKRDDHRSVIGIAQLMESRAEYLLQHVLLSKKSPEVSDCSTTITDQYLEVKLDVSEDVDRIQINYRSGRCGKPQSKLMHNSGPGIWNTDIPEGSFYYFVLSSPTGSALYPTHAPMELLEAK